MAGETYEKLIVALCKAAAAAEGPLQWCAAHGELDAARALVAHSPINPSQPNRHGDAPIHMAAASGNCDFGEWLLDVGVSIEAPGQANHTALTVAAAAGQLRVCSLLLQRGAASVLHCAPHSMLLLEAAREGEADVVRLALAAGADINGRDDKGRTALICAAARGELESAQVLIAAAADLQACNQWGSTALTAAILADGGLPIARALLDAGGHPNGSSNGGCTPLVEAVRRGNADALDLLLKAGANTNLRALGRRTTPLVLAAETGQLGMVCSLLRAHADIDRPAADGHTALIAALQNSHEDTARFLLERGADLAAADLRGRTALMYAAAGPSPATVRWLLACGASTEVRDSDGRTAIQLIPDSGFHNDAAFQAAEEAARLLAEPDSFFEVEDPQTVRDIAALVQCRQQAVGQKTREQLEAAMM